MTFSQTPKPDFAFPQTVSKNANNDLKLAIDKNDAHAALNALIRLCIADNMVDPDKAGASIATVESVAEHFAQSPLYGIYEALLAQMYYEYYSSSRWIYDSRSLPLEPLPSDISEWSGDQFKARITELCRKSCVEPLASLKIGDYADVITADKVTALFYPTLLDFACSNASSILSSIDGNPMPYYQIALDSATAANPSGPISAAQSTWITMLTPADKMLETYQKYADSEFSGKMLCEYISNQTYSYEYFTSIVTNEAGIKHRGIDKTDLIDAYLKKYPASIFRNQLLTCRQELTKPTALVHYPKFVAPGHPFEAKVTTENVRRLLVKLYEVPASMRLYGGINGGYKSLVKLTPLKTYKAEWEAIAPFQADTTLTVTIDKPGYYVMAVYFDDGTIAKTDNSSLSTMQCVPVMPIAIGNALPSYVAAVDAFTGEPMAGVGVTLSRNNQSKAAGTTADNGLVDVTSILQSMPYANISLTHNGTRCDFTDLNISRRDVDNDTYYDAVALTDRSIYRPGETVHAMAILKETPPAKDNAPREPKLMVGTNCRATFTNVNGKEVGSATCITDQYGRAAFEFAIPDDGSLTGRYSLRVAIDNPDRSIGYASVEVAEFKMPDFEIIVDPVQRDVPQPGCVTITGKAVTYSGVPLANTQISLVVSTASWWRWFAPSAEVCSKVIDTDQAGAFTVKLEPSDFEDANDDDKFFLAQFTATSPSGSVASASAPFSLGKQYMIRADLANSNVDGEKPCKPQVEVTAPDGKPATLPLTWTLKKYNDVIASGPYDGSIDLSSIKPGDYTLAFAPENPAIADTASIGITVYNVSSGIVPDSPGIWVATPSIKVDAATRTAQLLYGCTQPDTYIYYCMAVGDNVEYIRSVKCDAGYHTLKFDIPESCTSANLMLVSIKECKTRRTSVNISVDTSHQLTIEAESFRDKLVPGSQETWKFRILDAYGKPVEAAFAIDMYNKALEALAPHSFRLGGFAYQLSPSLIIGTPRLSDSWNSLYGDIKPIKFTAIEPPQFNLYGYQLVSGKSVYFNYSRAMVGSNLKMARAESAMDYAEVEECAVTDELFGSVGSVANADGAAPATPDMPDMQLRSAYVPLAVWAPTLCADADGNVCYTFTLPDANTTWRMQAIAWSQGMQVGNMLRDIVASKPIMVMPNMPRFLRAGDSAVVTALVINNTDSATVATSLIETFDPMSGQVIESQELTHELQPMESVTISLTVKASANMAAVGIRVKATNGLFADGEQDCVAILPSQAMLIETTPFYLNPGQESYTQQLPSQPGANITLTFCENPAWTIVSALPGLRQNVYDNANSIAASLFSAALSRGIINDNPDIAKALKHWLDNPNDSALVSRLEKNDHLKIATLESTPWVRAAMSDSERMSRLALIFNDTEVDAAITSAISRLKKMQNEDGGWKWAAWADESSSWVTCNVLEMIANLKALGMLPSDKALAKMTADAVRYLDKEVEHTDLLYCLIRPHFSEVPQSANGKKVTTSTINLILKDWKKYTDPAWKAMAAEALYLNNYKTRSRELMASISEFGVWTPDQGLTFPSVSSLASYAIILEAYAMIEPDNKAVDGLRQQLIVRKQANDWGTAVVTSQVVASILSAGSKWTVPPEGALVKVGSDVIEPKSAIEKYTGELQANLSAYAGGTLTIATPGTGPAYGAVYAQFSQQMAEVKAQSCPDLSIEKTMTVRRGTEWEVPTDTLAIGDRVKVQLTIHCQRPLQYVAINDERAAAFEPAEQVPGFTFSEGVGFYKENLDSETCLYVTYMPKGTYLLTYEMNVTRGGTYSSGVASIQSQYAPEIAAHSAGAIINVK